MSVTQLLEKIRELRPGQRKELAILLDDLIKRDERNQPKRSLTELEGLFAGAWDGVDAQDPY